MVRPPPATPCLGRKLLRLAFLVCPLPSRKQLTRVYSLGCAPVHQILVRKGLRCALGLSAVVGNSVLLCVGSYGFRESRPPGSSETVLSIACTNAISCRLVTFTSSPFLRCKVIALVLSSTTARLISFRLIHSAVMTAVSKHNKLRF